MEKTVLTVFSEHQSEKIIEKSRFITYSAHVESEEEARAFIAKIRSEHSLATHVCFAFISDKTGNLQRFSDDGEPQGTAGMPILEVLRAKGLKESGIAVVRYFGGIKLGAGGLVRAYSKAAAMAADANTCVETALAAFLSASFSYDLVSAFMRFAEKNELFAVTYDYGETVTARFHVRAERSQDILTALTEFLLGKCTAKEEKREYCRF